MFDHFDIDISQFSDDWTYGYGFLMLMFLRDQGISKYRMSWKRKEKKWIDR